MTPLEPALEGTLRRYVLGTLDEEARAQLEERLVKDPEVFAALGVVEDELIEEYLDDTLAETESRDLERHCLTTPDRARLPAFFHALKARAAAEADAPKPGLAQGRRLRPVTLHPAWVAAAAAALAVSLGLHAWTALGPAPLDVARRAEAPTRPSPDPRLALLTAERRDLQVDLDAEREKRERAEARVAELEGARGLDTTPIPTFTLAAGLLRVTGSVPRITAPPDAPIVRLRLDLPANDYPFYSAILRDADGNEIWSQSRLVADAMPDRIQLSILVPVSALSPGDYQMRLSGVTEEGEAEPLASYPFQIAAP